MKHTVSQRDPHHRRDAHVHPLRLRMFVHEIHGQTDHARAPAIEPKDLVRQIDDLPPFRVRQLRPSPGSGTLRDVFGPELAVEFNLKLGDFERGGLGEVHEARVVPAAARVGQGEGGLRVKRAVHRWVPGHSATDGEL